MPTIAQTPNQAYKDYVQRQNGTLSFTEWLHREKEKMYYSNGDDQAVLLINRPLNDSVQTAIQQTLKTGGLKSEESGKTVFGINKKILIVTGIAVGAIIIFLIAKKITS